MFYYHSFYQIQEFTCNINTAGAIRLTRISLVFIVKTVGCSNRIQVIYQFFVIPRLQR